MRTVEGAPQRVPKRWPAGAWFGAQVGTTAWLVTGAVEMATTAPWLAVLWLAVFAVANFLGTWLWRRHRLGQPSTDLLLLAVCEAAGLIAVVSFVVARPAGVAEAGVPSVVYLALLVLPAVAVLLTFVGRASRADMGKADPGGAADRKC
ncbi:hypothetical protein [Fimbriiglobus ruber]|uniref:Integral membrane protein n=1 Tax=Fimbriiglobus ruber TaxID=1908690 RepID=A0A225DV59_9BACT|nr:hypothetical protein [Fimbriiglobus ruber]OWK45410.1 hypothetical protein FRUB_01741 [Fimbriiglobus ruber]